jgi:hypothetical protein
MRRLIETRVYEVEDRPHMSDEQVIQLFSAGLLDGIEIRGGRTVVAGGLRAYMNGNGRSNGEQARDPQLPLYDRAAYAVLALAERDSERITESQPLPEPRRRLSLMRGGSA